MRIEVSLIVAMIALGSGCTEELGTPDGDRDSCSVFASAIADCGGDVPEEFDSQCNENPDYGDKLAAALCSSDTDDGYIGFYEAGDRCFNFNWECAGDLVCRPIDRYEDDQTCKSRATGGRRDRLCDDDADCAEGLLCIGENSAVAGECQ